MARMLEALRRIEADNRWVMPVVTSATVIEVETACEPPSRDRRVGEGIASAQALTDNPPHPDPLFKGEGVSSASYYDDPPFEPTFGPLVAWDRDDIGLAYTSHAIDDALDVLDELRDDLAAPTELPVATIPTTEINHESQIVDEQAAEPVAMLDAFDAAQVIAQHQRQTQPDVTFVGLDDAPAIAVDVQSTLQFAEHWATIALADFGIDSEPQQEEPAREPSPCGRGEDEGCAVAQEQPANPPHPDSLPQGEEECAAPATAHPAPSLAEQAALLDLSDHLLRAQYTQLGERVVADLGATTKTCAAIASVEHQPHVSDVTLRTAMTLCQSGKQVLMIDAALGDKHLTSGLGLMVEFGLSEVLKGRVPWQQAVRATATPGLCVLPAGRLPPPRLADDDHRLRNVLKELTSQWDLVLLDGGSLSETSALYVATAARNLYLVVRLGETAADAAEEVASSLASTEINLRGCIVTNAA